MAGIIGWIAGGIGVAGAVAAVVYWLHTAIANSASAAETTAALKVDADRIAKEEAAATQARADRTTELNAKIAAVRTTADAVAVLRGELSRAVGTPATDTLPGTGIAPRPAAGVGAKP